MKIVAAVVLALLGGAAAVRVAHPATPLTLPAPVARPNPALFGIRLDYVTPLRTASGGVADLTPLDPAATAAAYRDQRYLRYQLLGDLGGFVRAPVGSTALSTGGRVVVGAQHGKSQLPLFAQAAGGGIKSFTFTGGQPAGPPDNGHQRVPGLGQPPVTPPPTPGNTPPPPNQGFGGRPEPPGTTTTQTTTTTPTTTPKPPPTTTTATTPTPTTTTTTTTTTTSTAPSPPTTGGGSSPPPPPADCGAAGISITSNLAGCRIVATNMAPGDAASELVTIKNTSDSTYTLALKAAGTQNALWTDLRMAVYEQSTAPPNPLPPLLDWTLQYNDLRSLAPGQSVTYVITLYLPTSAGNSDQSLAAVVDFHWRATG